LELQDIEEIMLIQVAGPIFSPVRWEWISRWFGFVQQRQSSDTAFQL